MRLPKFARTTLTIKTPGTRTVHGSDVDDWANPTTREVRGALVVPAMTDELTKNRESVGEGFNVYVPAKDRLEANQKITWRGADGDYSVQGKASPVPSPSGGYSHILYYVERWTG